MGILAFAQKALGTLAGISADPTTAAAQTPGKSVINNTRAISSADGKTKQVNETTHYRVALVQGQPSTTPAAKNPEPPIPLDTYRAGVEERFTDTSGTENIILHKRQLGEPEDELASISITQQKSSLAQSVQSQISGGGFTGTFQGDIINTYSRFFLQSVVEQQTEKYQVVETFTAFYVFFYGKRPPFYRYSGMLLNDPLNKWTNDMMFFYENFFRGTRTAELGAQAVVSYNGRVVSGFIVGMTMQENADLDKGVPFSFDFLVLDHVPVNFSPDVDELIQRKTADLRAKAAAIKEQLAQINKDVPTEKQQIAAQVRNGKMMPDTIQAATGVTVPQTPPSNVISKIGL